MGFSEFERMKKEEKISKDPKLNAMVERVGRRIAAVAELPNAEWEFVVFENATPNAFCLPGGKIGIYTGILPITQSEAGLATVYYRPPESYLEPETLLTVLRHRLMPRDDAAATVATGPGGAALR